LEGGLLFERDIEGERVSFERVWERSVLPSGSWT
jgi:hypothetical protein